MNESKKEQILKVQPASRDRGSVAMAFLHLPVFFSVVACVSVSALYHIQKHKHLAVLQLAN